MKLASWAAGVRLASWSSSGRRSGPAVELVRRWVRIISGPSVAIVKATPGSSKRGTSRGPRPRRRVPSSTGSTSGRSRARSPPRGGAASARNPGRQDPWPIRSGRRSRRPHRATPRRSRPPRRRGSCSRDPPRGPSRPRRDLRVVVAGAAGARAGDVDPDDAAGGPADRLLDHDLVLPQANVRSIIRISPARTCGYSRLGAVRPRIAARMMWSRSRSPPRLRFIGLKRSSSVVIPWAR